MANGDPDDVIRSLRRYVSQALGSPPWKVRTERTRVDDDARPVAVVEEASPVTMPHARAGNFTQGPVQNRQAFAVVAYPELGATAAESRREATRIASLLKAAVSRGLVTGDTPPAYIGAPFRIPVYDFADVPVRRTGSTSRAGPTTPYEYLWVDETFSTRALQDPLDELRFTAVANLRLTWWEGGRIPPDAPLAEHMPGGWHPPAPLPPPPHWPPLGGGHVH